MEKNKLLLIFIGFVFLLSACGTKSMSPTKSVSPGEMAPLPEDGTTEITIEVVDYSNNFYASAAKKFEEETGIKVNVINDYDSGQSIEELITNLDKIKAELISGKGADIYAGFYLDYNAIGQNKHLCNMEGWISQDPDFTTDAYYMNIIRTLAVGDEMYAFPLFFCCNTLGSRVEVPELKSQPNLNWEQFFELTKDVKRSGVLYAFTDYDIFQRRYKDRADDFINAENKTQNLNSPEMIKLLEQCKEWSEQDLCVKYSAGYQVEIFDKAFFKEYATGIEGLLNIECEPGLYYYDIPSDCSENNKGNKIFPVNLVCINAASKYKGTAWEFAKFLLSEEIQLSGSDTPVNRKAAEKFINNRLPGLAESYGLTIDTEKTIKDTSDTLGAIGKISNGFVSPLEKIVFDEVKRYFRSEISADAAAKNMADKMELYFKEQ